MAQWVKNPPAMQETQETPVWSLGGEYPVLQYSYLYNPMDRGAWQTLVYGVTKTRTSLSNQALTQHSDT